jgi:hypothetical protein
MAYMLADKGKVTASETTYNPDDPHYYMGDNLLDTATTPTLTAVKAKDTRNAPPIRLRPSAALAEMERLKVISDLLIITEFLHMFTLRCNIGMNNCRQP